MNAFIVVDDDPINNKLCSYIIKKNFPEADIHCFESPVEGLQFVKTYSDPQSNKPTILLLDINMPEINGWHFLEEFEKMGSHVHNQFTVYIVSSSIDPSDRQKAESNVFVSDYLAKPLSVALVKEVGNIVKETV